MSLLTGSANCIRYVLFGFNLGLMITGIILIGVGIGVSSTFGDYKPFLETNFFSVPTFLIVIGSLVIVISFFGCFGALRENYLLIVIFSVLLALIFILELIAGISGYVLRGDAENLIERRLNATVADYKKDDASDAITVLWDYIQRDFECCGVKSYSDWQPRFKDDLPISCCNVPDGAVGSFNCTGTLEEPNRHKTGCLTKFSDFISSHAVSLGAVGIVLAVIQFLGVLFSCYIAREIKIRNGITGWF